jgi:ribonuclease BN (tRNA processing enzyme)
MGHRIDERNFGFELEFLELPTGDEREIGPVRARTFQTHHQPDTHPHGMLIETGEERIAYSGDTGWFDGLPEQVAGSALFICECTFLTPQYEFHLDHETLTQQRERFDCGRWILTHLGGDMSQAREEMRQAGQATSHTGKEGGFETADDGLVVEL